MAPQTKFKASRLANLQGTKRVLTSTLNRATTTLKRLATPRKTPAKKRRLETQENEPFLLPQRSALPSTPRQGPSSSPTTSHFLHRAWSIPSPKKLLFRVFSAAAPTSDQSYPRSTAFTSPVRELVAPGIRQHPTPDFVLSPSAHSQIRPLSPEPFYDLGDTTFSLTPSPRLRPGLSDNDSGSVRRLSRAPASCLPTDDAPSDDEDDHAADLRIPTSSSPVGLWPEGYLREAPTIEIASAALDDLRRKFRVHRKEAAGFVYFELNPFERDRLNGMKSMLNFYVNPRSKTYGLWAASSLQAAITMERGPYCARMLRRLVRAYIADRTVLPVNPYGEWKTSMLCDEDLSNELTLHLQELGDAFTCHDIVRYLDRPEVKEKHGISKTVSDSTALRWLDEHNYQYSYTPRGQYTDGHERPDVVWYRRCGYIPEIQALLQRSVEYNFDGEPIYPQRREFYEGRQVIIWYHDESIFYAHDRRRKSWFHKDASPKPYKKGEGASLMIADFVSAEFGWLRSPDGSASARSVFKPGANRDGYFNNDDIRKQAQAAADIVLEHYPDYEHVFVYDNATTHRKRADDALSARKMPKYPSPSAAKNWLLSVSVINAESGRPERLPNNKIRKQRIRMGDTINPATGAIQSLYFPDDHPTRPGLFKGMGVILMERGWLPSELEKGAKPVECEGFKCEDTSPYSICCTRRIMFNQPDFANVPSLLEMDMSARGIRVLFLPKFHCELNPIELCWGYAKRVYRLNPASSREEDLIQNALDALDEISLVTIRRFFNRAHRFVDAYAQGLDGRESAWACRKYKGHRMLPSWIKEDLEAVSRQK